MKLSMKRRALAALVLSSLAGAAFAQTFPSKAIRIVVPNGAGGGADLTARTVGQKISETLGQAVIVDNKPGAGGVIAGEIVAKAAPDGYTLLLISSGTAVSASLFKSLPFDTVRDFIPVAPLATFDLVIVVAEESRFKTLAELIAWSRANPGKLNIGTPNIGTTQNLAAELFKSAAGLNAQIVPFNGTPAVINALRGGQKDAGLALLGPFQRTIKPRAMLALAITAAQPPRSPPNCPPPPDPRPAPASSQRECPRAGSTADSAPRRAWRGPEA